jgi:uncharacterized damage-inducible protein DinB
MTKKSLSLSLGLVLLGSVCARTVAASPHKAQAHSGYKSEMLMFIGDAEDKLNQLAEAIPKDKYSWRPAEGIRSAAEVFMHVAAANYGIPGFWGVKPPEGFNFATYEKSLTAKADIRKALADSFTYMKKHLEAASDADLAKPTEFFGHKATVRAGYLLLLSHAHEHLGQLIAYARMNGVVPPWTAKQQEMESKQHPAAAK